MLGGTGVGCPVLQSSPGTRSPAAEAEGGIVGGMKQPGPGSAGEGTILCAAAGRVFPSEQLHAGL